MAKRRSSGDGTVRRRNDGRWEGRIIIGHISQDYHLYFLLFLWRQICRAE